MIMSGDRVPTFDSGERKAVGGKPAGPVYATAAKTIAMRNGMSDEGFRFFAREGEIAFAAQVSNSSQAL